MSEGRRGGSMTPPHPGRVSGSDPSPPRLCLWVGPLPLPRTCRCVPSRVNDYGGLSPGVSLRVGQKPVVNGDRSYVQGQVSEL